MELYEYSAYEIAKMYRNKEITVPEVISSIYKRIEEEPENQDGLKDLVQEKEIQVESAVSKAMQSAVIQHSRLEDEGLKFYRNPEFKESVTWFYTQITGNKVVTEAILMAADENDIPVSNVEFRMINNFELKDIQDVKLTELQTYRFFKYKESIKTVSFELEAQGYHCG